MNKKAFQLSINMLVVIILGIVILGVGISMFYGAYAKVADAREKVGDQNMRLINSLLDDGSVVSVPLNTKDGRRGRFVDFEIGINNEFGVDTNFTVLITYAGSTAFDDNPSLDPFNPISIDQLYVAYTNEDYCGNNNPVPESCAYTWVLVLDTEYSIENNARAYVPLRIVIPKDNTLGGQYVFNIDVCASENNFECIFDGDKLDNRYSSRKKLYINI